MALFSFAGGQKDLSLTQKVPEWTDGRRRKKMRGKKGAERQRRCPYPLQLWPYHNAPPSWEGTQEWEGKGTRRLIEVFLMLSWE